MQISERFYNTLLKDSSLRVIVITSLFNEHITLELEKAAVEALKKLGVFPQNILTQHVPGAWELPLAAAHAFKEKKADAVIACGCVIRGDTGHYDIVAKESAEGLMRVSLDFLKPVMNAVLTVENLAQAEARSVSDQTNKGAEAARSLVELMNSFEALR